jgi:hypothetical protein
MHRKDVNERSPLRLLEKSIHGGLGRGNLGVVIARTGVGKTAFLVSVALDDLMRGRNVLHVALDQTVDKVHALYEELFQDLAHAQQLEDVWKVRVDLERHRRIHCYSPPAFSPARLRETMAFLREQTDFVPAAIIVDGYDFTRATPQFLAELRSLARESAAEMWMSAITTRAAGRDGRGIPEPVAGLEGGIDVILSMAHDGKAVHIGLHKDHDNPDVPDLKLALDPTTMLLVRE